MGDDHADDNTSLSKALASIPERERTAFDAELRQIDAERIKGRADPTPGYRDTYNAISRKLRALRYSRKPTTEEFRRCAVGALVDWGVPRRWWGVVNVADYPDSVKLGSHWVQPATLTWIMGFLEDLFDYWRNYDTVQAAIEELNHRAQRFEPPAVEDAASREPQPQTAKSANVITAAEAYRIAVEAAAAAPATPQAAPPLTASPEQAAGPKAVLPPPAAKQRKDPKGVIVDPDDLMGKLKNLNAKREHGRREPLKLTARGLAAASPPGGPHIETWKKLLTGKRIREAVLDRLIAFFKVNGLELKLRDFKITEV